MGGSGEKQEWGSLLGLEWKGLGQGTKYFTTHARALTRVEVGRINLFALFEPYIRRINYLPKGFTLKTINANTITLLNC